MKRRAKIKKAAKAETVATGVTGTASIISAHNVCHAVCLGAVAFLSLFGIAISSTALMFLQDYNLIFWSMGLFFLIVSAILYLRLGCVSKKAMTANAGILVAGVPLQTEQLTFWLIGGSIFLIILGKYINQKWFVEWR